MYKQCTVPMHMTSNKYNVPCIHGQENQVPVKPYIYTFLYVIKISTDMIQSVILLYLFQHHCDHMHFTKWSEIMTYNYIVSFTTTSMKFWRAYYNFPLEIKGGGNVFPSSNGTYMYHLHNSNNSKIIFFYHFCRSYFP